MTTQRKLERHITALRNAARERFGEQVDSSCGAATIQIDPNHIELVDERNTIVAVGAASVALELARTKK